MSSLVSTSNGSVITRIYGLDRFSACRPRSNLEHAYVKRQKKQILRLAAKDAAKRQRQPQIPFGDDNRKGKAGGRPRDSNIDGELNSSGSFDCVWSKSAPNFAQDDGVLVLG